MSKTVASLVSVLALCVSFLLIGNSQVANANSDCDQTAPLADVVTSQTASLQGSTVVYTITLTNLGPCPVPDITFTDLAPAQVLSADVLPMGWNCSFAGNTTACAPTNTMGVPGTVRFTITTYVPTGDPTNVASAVVGGGASACTDGSAATTCDPTPDNNTSYGGLVTDTATDRTLHTPRSAQWTELHVPFGHTLSAQIQQLTLASCPAGTNNCFGQLVNITSASTAPDAQLKDFFYPLDMVPSWSSATMKFFDAASNTWVEPAPCKGKVLPDPCLLTKERLKIGGITHVHFVISTTEDDSWMGDS